MAVRSYQNLDVDESEDQVAIGPVEVKWLHVMNRSTGVRYLKVYDGLAADVVVGTDTPIHTFTIPTQGDTNGAGFVLSPDLRIKVGTALTIAATTGVAVSDTGAPGANDVVVNLGYSR
jgi:hypothetical protein